MHARILLGAIAALSLAGTAAADIIDVGTFANVSGTGGDYQGAYAAHVSWMNVDGGPVQIRLNVSTLLDELGYDALGAIRVIDTGNNIYGANSSGADIDLFTVSGLWDDVTTTWVYDGLTPTHQNETSAQLAQRLIAIDAQAGVHESGGPFHLSLGNAGVIAAHFSQPQGIQDDFIPGLAGTGDPILLNLREAGVGESFRIEIMTATIPAPGGMALFAVATLVGRRRRRS